MQEAIVKKVTLIRETTNLRRKWLKFMERQNHDDLLCLWKALRSG